MIPVLALLMAGLVDTNDEAARRRASNELQNRLGLREGADSPLRLRVLYALRHVVPKNALMVRKFLFVVIDVFKNYAYDQRYWLEAWDLVSFSFEHDVDELVVDHLSYPPEMPSRIYRQPQESDPKEFAPVDPLAARWLPPPDLGATPAALTLVAWAAVQLERIYAAEVEAVRHHLLAGAYRIVPRLGLPAYSTPMTAEEFDDWLVRQGDGNVEIVSTGMRESLYATVLENVNAFQFGNADLPSLLDFLGRAPPANLMSLDLHELVTASRTWHLQFKTLAFQAPVADGWVVATWPDGMHVDRLVTKEQLESEGLAMAHCVGGYWAHVRENVTTIYSVRTREGVPKLTVEIDRRGQVVQVQAPRDVTIGEAYGDEPELACRLAGRLLAFLTFLRSDPSRGTPRPWFERGAGRSVYSAVDTVTASEPSTGFGAPPDVVMEAFQQVLDDADARGVVDDDLAVRVFTTTVFDPMRDRLAAFVRDVRFSHVVFHSAPHDSRRAYVTSLLTFETLGVEVEMTARVSELGDLSFTMASYDWRAVPFKDELSTRGFLDLLPSKLLRVSSDSWTSAWLLLEQGAGMTALHPRVVIGMTETELVAAEIVDIVGRGRHVVRR